MPIQECEKEGKKGKRWGTQTCYTGTQAEEKAAKQAAAIKISEAKKGK